MTATTEPWKLVMTKRISDLLPKLSPPRKYWRRHLTDFAVMILCIMLLVAAWIVASLLFAGRHAALPMLLAVGAAGCCKAPSVKYVDVPVKVQVPCVLPPAIALPAVMRQVAGCHEKLVCYDIANAALIADRESKMKTWIKEAKAACGAPPASKPATLPARAVP